MTVIETPQTWTNWAGNISCRPHEVAYPTSEDDVRDVLASAAARGLPVRITGAGHSFTPIHVTDGVLISLARMNAIHRVDSEVRRVVAGPGTRIRDFGDPLWEAGLTLKNQGDIDSQHIVGAISTATHGSGIRQQAFCGSLRRARVVLPSGEVIDVGEDDSELLAAMQVSLGALGVITEAELEVRDAFALAERIEFWGLDEILGRWDDEMANHRHFSFFWMPSADSPDRLFMEYPEGMDMADRSRVKLYDELPAEVLDDPEFTRPRDLTRLDRPYRIYPDPDFQGEIVMRELEYMVPFEQGKDAFLALRELVLSRYPENKYPIEIRSIASDTALLSPFYERDSISVSICGHEYLDYRTFLADVAKVLEPFDPRPHWGKIHYMDRERLARAFPRYEDFRAIRRRLDPDGLLLDASMRDLVG
jgi:FAD/FMN-containing dehydrogenase